MDNNTPPDVLAVYGGKGGIGKTTVATNMAWHLGTIASTGLVDADYQESATRLHKNYSVPAPYTLTDGDTSGLRYVVMDMPPSIEEARPLLTSARLIVVPFVVRDMDATALMRTLMTDLIGLPRVVVMSRVTHHHKPTERTIRAVLEGLDVPVTDTVLREFGAAHDRANSTGVPLLHPDAQGYKVAEAAADMRNLADEIHTLMGAMK